MSEAAQPFLERLLRRLPLIGYAIRLMDARNFQELSLFGTNMVMFVVLGVILIGYPFLILVLYGAVALAAALILLATRG